MKKNMKWFVAGIDMEAHDLFWKIAKEKTLSAIVEVKRHPLESVMKNPMNIMYITNPTDLVIETAIKACGLAIKYVPKNRQKYSWRKMAVENDPRAIAFVIQDPKLAWIAINQCGMTVQYIDADILTSEMELKAVNVDPFAVEFVSPTVKNQMEAVKCTPVALKVMKNQRMEVVKFALKQYGPDAVSYIERDVMDRIAIEVLEFFSEHKELAREYCNN